MIKVGVIGYGEVGKGAIVALKNCTDMELKAVFTQRVPKSVCFNEKGVDICSYKDILRYEKQIDVMINCGGSARDLPKTTPETARYFNIVDSYDVHSLIPEHLVKVNSSSLKGGKTAIVSVGWDPGIFSVERLCFSSFLPKGNSCTFWGKGVSRGHTNAVKEIDGVIDAVQFTIPSEKALDAACRGEILSLSKKEMHVRECYVSVEKGANTSEIEEKIKKMPHYFEGYETKVFFVSEEEVKEKSRNSGHGGRVIRSGITGEDTCHVASSSLSLGSNPEFTGSVLICYARAAYRLNIRGEIGGLCAFDIPPILLSPLMRDEAVKAFL